MKNTLDTGIDWISIVVIWYQTTINSTIVKPIEGQSVTNFQLIIAIEYAHTLGLRVVLKPHVDLSEDPNHWRGEIGTYFTDKEWNKWFQSYRAYLRDITSLAATYRVEMMIVGT